MSEASKKSQEQEINLTTLIGVEKWVLEGSYFLRLLLLMENLMINLSKGTSKSEIHISNSLLFQKSTLFP